MHNFITFLFLRTVVIWVAWKHERRQRGTGGGPYPPWIFIHGTDLVNKG